MQVVDSTTWAQTLLCANNFCRKRSQASMKVCVIEDFDVYACCDRGALCELKQLLINFAQKPVSVVFGAEAAVAQKIATRKHGLVLWHSDKQSGYKDECMDRVREVSQTRLEYIGGVDAVYDIAEDTGGTMFVDTLFHNTPDRQSSDPERIQSHVDVAVRYATMYPLSASAGALDAQARLCVNGYRASLLCGQANCTRARAHLEYTNSLSQCNLRAAAIKGLESVARRDGCTLGESVWASSSDEAYAPEDERPHGGQTIERDERFADAGGPDT